MENHKELAKPLSPSRAKEIPVARKPEWIKMRAPGGDEYLRIKALLKDRKLATVCQEANCPNISECWNGGTATFMLGGEICTRACRFCHVKTARRPPPLDPDEPKKVAESVSLMKLKYVVLTSVDRDDLEDGGAMHFADTIRAIKALDSDVIVEALVPDFKGDHQCVEIVLNSGLDVYAHNVETVKRLQYRVRDPRAGYEQSLRTLRYAKDYSSRLERRAPLFTKSSVMVGLGETNEELSECFDDLRAFQVDVLTLGQYLRPTKAHLPVERFVSPAGFDELKETALKKGFVYVAAGPMVRSSYRAGEYFLANAVKQKRELFENGLNGNV